MRWGLWVRVVVLTSQRLRECSLLLPSPPFRKCIMARNEELHSAHSDGLMSTRYRHRGTTDQQCLRCLASRNRMQ
eukprot:6399089-Amphidinium_carterae.1